MLKTYVRQRFRIKNIRTGEYEKLNQVLSKNNTWVSVAPFDTIEEAKQLLTVYCPDKATREACYIIEPFDDKRYNDIPQPTSEKVRAELEKQRRFSGAGLKYNTMSRVSVENKYKQGVFYGRDVWFAQTVERSKGKSVIFNQTKQRKKRGNAITQDDTCLRMTGYGEFKLGGCIIDSIRKQLDKFPNRKALKDWLKERGYSNRHINRIISQVHNPTI